MSKSRYDNEFDFGDLFDDETPSSTIENTDVFNTPSNTSSVTSQNNNSTLTKINLDNNYDVFPFNAPSAPSQNNNITFTNINVDNIETINPKTNKRKNEENLDEGTKKRRERSRKSAKTWRDNKNTMIAELEVKNKELTQTVNQLTVEIGVLKKESNEIETLKNERDYWINQAAFYQNLVQQQNDLIQKQNNLLQQQQYSLQQQNYYQPPAQPVPAQPAAFQFSNSQNFLFFNNNEPSNTINTLDQFDEFWFPYSNDK